jgi:hypothetical protein
MKKEIILISIIFFSLVFSVKVKAELTFDNSTFTVLSNAEDSCFKDSSQGLFDFNFEERPDSECTGPFASPPNYCERTIRIFNPTGETFPVSVQVIPIPAGLPCPAPDYTNNHASIRFLPSGDPDRAQFNYPDMNECWNWWCYNTTTTTSELRCPFGWNGLRYLGVLGRCSRVNVTIGDAMSSCPTMTFTVQSDDYFFDIKTDWMATPPNDVDIRYLVKVKGYATGYTDTIETTYNNKTLQSGVDKYITGLQTIVGVNVDFLSILYLIFEIMAIIVTVIGLPALIIMLIKWVWEQITGRPFGFGRRKREVREVHE